MEIKVSVVRTVKKQILENLMFAHKNLARTTETKKMILLTKFILCLAKNLNDELFDFVLEENSDKANHPPQ